MLYWPVEEEMEFADYDRPEPFVWIFKEENLKLLKNKIDVALSWAIQPKLGLYHFFPTVTTHLRSYINFKIEKS